MRQKAEDDFVNPQNCDLEDLVKEYIKQKCAEKI